MTTTDVRLLKGTEQLYRVPLDMGGGVQSCDITDPYILVLLVDGTVALLWLEEVGGVPTLQFTWPELAKGARVSLISAYTDTTGLFITTSIKQEGADRKGAGLVGVAIIKEEPTNMDDEDELLYGNGDALTAKPGSSTRQPPPPAPPSQTLTRGVASPLDIQAAGTNWFALARDDGSLELYQLNQGLCRLAFCVRNFSAVPHTLKDSGPLVTE